MANLINDVRRFLKQKGMSKKDIDRAVNWMQTTCVACKHADECKRVGIINEPYHPKCERHEFTDKIIFRS